MNRRKVLSSSIIGILFLLSLAAGTGSAQTIDELYQRALKEGGRLNFYSTLAQINAVKILPAFEKRFPGIKVNHVDATGDKLVARAVTEARGGRIIADVFQGSLEYVSQLNEQKLLEDWVPPESAVYPKGLKGSYWVASDLQFIIASWNTNLVKTEPKQYEEFADTEWKNRLIADPRDWELLAGMTKKYGSREKAIELLKKFAENNVEFHRGHSRLAELLVAGQAAACITCYSHHYPPRIKKGAPVGYMLTEGIGSSNGTAVFANAPHPNTARLWARWGASEEGQKAYAMGGRTPAHPNVEPVEKTRPETIYALEVEDIRKRSEYEKIWKEVFQLR